MQQFSQVLFCEQCGLANDPEARQCTACQHRLTHETIVPGPCPIVSRPVREVIAGQDLSTAGENKTSELLLGSILAGTYQIMEEIGRGGFSIVYRAVELGDRSRQVAIKRIPLSTLTPGQMIDATETFNRELAMLKRFSGRRGVPRWHGHLADQENWYLIMEYIEGVTLDEYIHKLPEGYIKEATTIELGIKLTQIFHGLHTEQPAVVFRDVKPANMMLSTKGELYLIDFGIARNFTQGKTRDTTLLGSPGFAPPEQYGRSQTDQRSDIYGLGATLQTLVTGLDPLELAAGESPRNPMPLSSDLRVLLNEMLASDPAQRPVSMLDVQTRLEDMLPQNATLTAQYGRFLILSLIVLALFVILSSVLAWWSIPLLIYICFKLVIADQRLAKLRLARHLAKIIALLPLLSILWLLAVLLWHVFSNQ